MDGSTATSSPHEYSLSVRRSAGILSTAYAAGAGYPVGLEVPDDQAFGLHSRCSETTVREQIEEVTSLPRQLSEAKQVLPKLGPNRKEARSRLHGSTLSAFL